MCFNCRVRVQSNFGAVAGEIMAKRKRKKNNNKKASPDKSGNSVLFFFKKKYFLLNLFIYFCMVYDT